MRFLFTFIIATTLHAAPRNVSKPIALGNMPARVHVFEDYETEIEKRWWLRGTPVKDNLAPCLSASRPNTRASRATDTKDFDRKQGDQSKQYKAVIFNPGPGPPMSANTRLTFRYWLKGTDTLRVQIYSLSKNYHRHLLLQNLPQGKWQTATVDMTKARRPDGSGGPLATDERIDDIQFYIDPEADLRIDDIILYDAAAKDEPRPFPRRIRHRPARQGMARRLQDCAPRKTPHVGRRTIRAAPGKATPVAAHPSARHARAQPKE